MTQSTKISRVRNWETSLFLFLEEWDTFPFQWGKYDCVHMAARWQELAHGLSVFPEIFDPDFSYDTALGAARTLRSLRNHYIGSSPLKGVAPIISTRLPEVPLSFAGRGDIALIRNHDREEMLAIHLGHTLAAKGVTGTVYPPVSKAILTWRI